MSKLDEAFDRLNKLLDDPGSTKAQRSSARRRVRKLLVLKPEKHPGPQCFRVGIPTRADKIATRGEPFRSRSGVTRYHKPTK